MPSIQGLLDRARELGESIAAHERVQAYFAAQRAVGQDPAAQQILREYGQHVQHIRELERAQRPIEVADKQKLAELESRIAGNEQLKGLARVQADYVELMDQINSAMGAPLAALAQPEGGA
jgi:cell fate (sporulation/competence/biofilm development) regulator YlbF (YheA/YmcA/DUF963 family)